MRRNFVEGQADFEIDVRNVNGRTVVDSQFFVDNLGLSQEQATHQSPGGLNVIVVSCKDGLATLYSSKMA